MPITKDFKLEELSKYFHMPEKAVAKELGICLTSLKKLCRSYGITRWPFRKLKSIQRTLAKVQDETFNPSMSAQFVAAGLALPGNEGAAAAMAAQQGAAAAAAAAAAGGRAANGADGKTPAVGTDAGGAHVAAVAGQQDAAKVPLLPVIPVEGHLPLPATGGRGGVVRKRKPFQVGGRTLMMTEEEKSIYELTIGKTGVQMALPPSAPAPPPHPPPAHAASTPANARDNPARALRGGSEGAVSGSATPKDRLFGCQAVACNLEVTNWATLWTQEHLQKRLLEPLGGLGMHFSADMLIAYLNFENERTAQRAELICRAAAAAAEKNLRTHSSAGSRSATPPTAALHALQDSSYNAGSTLSAQRPLQLVDSGSSESSKGASATVKVEAPDFKERGKQSANTQLKLEIGMSGGGGGRGMSCSPVFKSTPVTPPTSMSDTSHLFDSSFHDASSFALLPSSSMGYDFQNHDAYGSCVEVSSTSILSNMVGPDDMTSALMAGGSVMSMGTMAHADSDELLSGDVLMSRSPLAQQCQMPGSDGSDAKEPSSKDLVKRKERSPRVGAPLAKSPLLAPTSGPVSPSLAPMPPPRA